MTIYSIITEQLTFVVLHCDYDLPMLPALGCTPRALPKANSPQRLSLKAPKPFGGKSQTYILMTRMGFM